MRQVLPRKKKTSPYPFQFHRDRSGGCIERSVYNGPGRDAAREGCPSFSAFLVKELGTMRVILEIQSGPLSGNRIELKPGEHVRLGRTSKSDFAFSDDSHMSGIHFALECSEDACRILDANSRNGILLNGEKVSVKALTDGDQIVAGETRFRVRIDGNEPSVPPAPIAPPVKQPVPVGAPAGPPKPDDRLLTMLRKDLQPLYAVLDAAREPSVLKVLFESNAEYQSLFAGADGAKLTHFAPYLVRLPEDAPFLETLARETWGRSWGVYLTCDQPLPALRAHFRQFLMVNQPDGKQVYFRFYDPRVLRIYLPTCLPEEVRQFFGPVKYYWMEDEKPNGLLRFSNAVRGVGLRRFPLVSEAEPGHDT